MKLEGSLLKGERIDALRDSVDRDLMWIAADADCTDRDRGVPELFSVAIRYQWRETKEGAAAGWKIMCGYSSILVDPRNPDVVRGFLYERLSAALPQGDSQPAQLCF